MLSLLSTISSRGLLVQRCIWAGKQGVLSFRHTTTNMSGRIVINIPPTSGYEVNAPCRALWAQMHTTIYAAKVRYLPCREVVIPAFTGVHTKHSERPGSPFSIDTDLQLCLQLKDVRYHSELLGSSLGSWSEGHADMKAWGRLLQWESKAPSK